MLVFTIAAVNLLAQNLAKYFIPSLHVNTQYRI
jgi:hypothetical protein